MKPGEPTPSSGGGVEFERIARYFQPLAAAFPGAHDLQDDAGYVTVPPGQELVVTTDAMVAGVHFLADDPPGLIAAKLLRTNLSDLAAKGADPLAYSLVTALPRTIDDSWLAAFCQGLAEDQARYGIHLLGGDTISMPGPLMLTVSALGLVPQGRAVMRGGARAGDAVFVTGTIGDATLGLQLALGQRAAGALPPEQANFLLRRLRCPDPRTVLAASLRDVATAAADVSDGLLADLGHIAKASRLTAALTLPAVPLSPAAARGLALGWATPVDLITGGDDYEIVFTAPPSRRAAIADLSARLGLPITEVGRMAPISGDDQRPARVFDDGGRDVTPVRTGWQQA